MTKLLSEKETLSIASKMTAAYGLPRPILSNENRYGSQNWGVRIEIVRPIKVKWIRWLPWINKTINIKVENFYADNFEDALTRLQNELSRFDTRTKVAEQFRDKYVQQEADEVLDRVLREK